MEEIIIVKKSGNKSIGGSKCQKVLKGEFLVEITSYEVSSTFETGLIIALKYSRD